jgi:ribA/ribD-fused uncharacterized protein
MYSVPIMVNGIVYPSSEHYYQWLRFSDPIIKRRILTAPTPLIAKRISDNNKHLLIHNADDDQAMLTALRAKFNQHRDLTNALLATGNSPLVYHRINDIYWADGGDGIGENKLGQLLMRIRSELA